MLHREGRRRGRRRPTETLKDHQPSSERRQDCLRHTEHLHHRFI